jgi:hypothetical protein
MRFYLECDVHKLLTQDQNGTAIFEEKHVSGRTFDGPEYFELECPYSTNNDL